MDEQREALFWAKVQKGKDDECWLWTASLDGRGYGQFWNGCSNNRAHRISYELARGPIPEGMSIHHQCEVKRCVNPDHLLVCTHQENMTTGKWGAKQLPRCAQWQLAKTHCPQGHPLEHPNLHVHKDGRKQCKICYDASRREWDRRNRAQHREKNREKLNAQQRARRAAAKLGRQGQASPE